MSEGMQKYYKIRNVTEGNGIESFQNVIRNY